MFESLIRHIEEFNTIIIIGHRFPDGDCYGSQVGLKELIQTRYPRKQVFVVGTGFAPSLDVLGKPDQIDDHLFKDALAICVDTSDMDRLEDGRFRLASKRFKIDHHIESYPFGGESLVLTHYIATAEIITRMAFQLNWKVNQKAAWALAMGIITDSNRFLYDLVTAQTFSLMEYLMKSGVQIQEIYDRLYQTSLTTFPIKEHIYAHVQTDPRGILFCIFKRDDLFKLKLSPIQAVGYVNMLANVKDYPIWFMAAEDATQVHIEIRSSNLEVQSLALSYGGGGHLKASGFRLPSLDHIPTMIEQIKVK
jgi:phosphoesterase RecJ-like protein